MWIPAESLIRTQFIDIDVFDDIVALDGSTPKFGQDFCRSPVRRGLNDFDLADVGKPAGDISDDVEPMPLHHAGVFADGNLQPTIRSNFSHDSTHALRRDARVKVRDRLETVLFQHIEKPQ